MVHCPQLDCPQKHCCCWCLRLCERQISLSVWVQCHQLVEVRKLVFFSFAKMSSTKSQYYTVLCANLTILTYGIGVGWPSATLPLLMSSESPLPSGPISLFEASWIGSIICIGGALGTIIYGWVAEVVGRKFSMMTTFVPTIVLSLSIAFPPSRSFNAFILDRMGTSIFW